MEDTIFAWECANGTVEDIIPFIKNKPDINIEMGLMYAYFEKNMHIIKYLLSVGSVHIGLISELDENDNSSANLIYSLCL